MIRGKRGKQAIRAAAALLLCTPLALSACATSGSYAGIPLAPAVAHPDLQDLARRAQAGDKYAHLELGIRYEEGRGVPRDFERAVTLYELAAAPGPAVQTHIYVPPARAGASGRVIAVRPGLPQAGLAEAARRLSALRSAGY